MNHLDEIEHCKMVNSYFQTESSGMSSEQLEWFCALSEGNIEKMTDLLSANAGLLEERDENQVSY